jgi:hypothetical protein
MRETMTADDFHELDEHVEMLLTLRADPPEGTIAADLPSLIDLACGDPHLLAILETRLERAQRMPALGEIWGEA